MKKMCILLYLRKSVTRRNNVKNHLLRLKVTLIIANVRNQKYNITLRLRACRRRDVATHTSLARCSSETNVTAYAYSVSC